MEERPTAERAEGIRQGIEQHGGGMRGRKELLKHLDGERLTMKQAILAKCYGCMGYFSDGRQDCKIDECPLYPFMPFREGEKRQFIKRPNTRLNVARGDREGELATNPPQGESTYTGEVINAKITHRQHGAEGRV